MGVSISKKPFSSKVVPADLHNLMPQGNGPLHIRAAQVQIAILQADRVPYIGVLHNLSKGRGGRLGQQTEFGDLHLDVPGGQLGILGLPLPDQPLGGDDILPRREAAFSNRSRGCCHQKASWSRPVRSRRSTKIRLPRFR